MPHHSGGGSHSGGSHHSSGHHSGGSHSSGSSNKSYISKKPFLNSKKFRYYDRNGKAHYIYSTQMPEKPGISNLISVLIIFSLFLFGGISITAPSLKTLKPPEPLTPVYESPDSHIEDHIGAMDNETSLENVLKDFEDLTGISPYIITVYDSEWQDRSVDLIDYSYDLYENHFDDEQHFLIVYSEPENADALSFLGWRWEAIQGDETDDIITEENFERFQSDLQEGLTRDSVLIGKALEDAFNNSLDYMMTNQNNIDIPSILFFMIWFAIIIVAMIFVLRDYMIRGKVFEEVSTENAVGNNSDFYYQNDDQKFNQNNLKTGGGYILNGEYYDPSKKN